MNNIFLVIVLIGCAALIHGTGYAAPSRASAPQAAVASSANAAGDKAPVAEAAKANHSRQLSENAGHSMLANAMNLHQPGSAKTVVARKIGSIQNQGARAAFSVRHAVLLSNGPSPIVVRHRSFNPAVVGGSGNTNAKSAGAINGTRMSRKP